MNRRHINDIEIRASRPHFCWRLSSPNGQLIRPDAATVPHKTKQPDSTAQQSQYIGPSFVSPCFVQRLLDYAHSIHNDCMSTEETDELKSKEPWLPPPDADKDSIAAPKRKSSSLAVLFVGSGTVVGGIVGCAIQVVQTASVRAANPRIVYPLQANAYWTMGALGGAVLGLLGAAILALFVSQYFVIKTSGDNQQQKSFSEALDRF